MPRKGKNSVSYIDVLRFYEMVLDPERTYTYTELNDLLKEKFGMAKSNSSAFMYRLRPSFLTPVARGVYKRNPDFKWRNGKPVLEVTTNKSKGTIVAGGKVGSIESVKAVAITGLATVSSRATELLGTHWSSMSDEDLAATRKVITFANTWIDTLTATSTPKDAKDPSFEFTGGCAISD